MTDKPPATPELPEPELGYIETDKSRQPAFSAAQMRAALQSAQPAAAVSDADVWGLWLRVCAESDNVSTRVMIANFARAILALRPQAVPMTEADLLKCLIQANCLGTVHMSHEHGPYYIDRPSHAAVRLKDAMEAHHGITAQGAQEGV